MLNRSDAAMRLGVTLEAVQSMIDDGTLFAVRFATGVRVMLDDADLLPQNGEAPPTR